MIYPISPFGHKPPSQLWGTFTRNEGNCNNDHDDNNNENRRHTFSGCAVLCALNCEKQ